MYETIAFCSQNPLKFTYVHIRFQKLFRGLYPRTPINRGGAERGEGGRRRREGWEGREGREEKRGCMHPSIRGDQRRCPVRPDGSGSCSVIYKRRERLETKIGTDGSDNWSNEL
jgi:hypothetical protein